MPVSSVAVVMVALCASVFCCHGNGSLVPSVAIYPHRPQSTSDTELGKTAATQTTPQVNAVTSTVAVK